MADITIRSVLAKIGFKVDDAGLKKANREVDESKKQIDKTEQAAKRLSGEFGKTASAAEIGFGKTARVAKSLGVEAKKAGGDVEGLTRRFDKLGQMLGAGALTGLAFGLAGTIGEASERIGQLDAAAGSLPFTIDAARKSTQGLVSDFELTTAGAAAFRSQLVTSGDQFSTFSEDVARLAAASGDKVGTSVSRMVAELKNGSTALLEQYGVTIDAEDAVKSYAAAHGKLVEDLTDTEKKQAIAAEGMKRLHDRAQELGGSLDSASLKVQRADAKLENLGDTLKRGVVVAAGETVGAVESLGEAIGTGLYNAVSSISNEPLQTLEQRLVSIQAEMQGVAGATVDTIAELSLGSQALEDFYRTQVLARRKAAKDAAQPGEDGRAPPKLANLLDANGNVIGQYRDTSAAPVDGIEAELQREIEKDQERERRAHAKARLERAMGPEPPPAKKGGAAKPGPAYELRTLQLITGATGDAGDDAISEMLAGYKQGKTAKKLSVEELYDKLKRTRDPKAKQDLRAQLDRHFLDLVSGGSPAGVGGPSSGGAQGLGTRIINVDARITAEVTVPAPEGLVGAGEVEGRRVAQTLGRDIAAELDPYFADQATVIRRAVEG